MNKHPVLQQITERITRRSQHTRADYLERMRRAADQGPWKANLGCGNLAHAFAAGSCTDKDRLTGESRGNIGIITAYNDMLSAHQPYAVFPDLVKQVATEQGGTAQVAGGVPAMCDGVTQGQPGMELSLFSRDVIAMSAAVGLSHNVFDAAVFLGTCDKIVPGLVIAAATFGHLPSIFLPAGPMPSGIPNKQKARARQQFAVGEIGREGLLQSEMQSYHAPGTCTFYGTANSNQMLMEIMGLQLPGSSFENPLSELRPAFTVAGAKRLLQLLHGGEHYTPAASILDIKNFVNGIVGLHATGGSTNLVIHMIAMARAAGIIIEPDDFAALSAVTPLMARVYPNGEADVNAFHAAGGMAFLVHELLQAGLLHDDVTTVAGDGLQAYTRKAKLNAEGEIAWGDAVASSSDLQILRPVDSAFQSTGGLQNLQGNLGQGIIKVSALPDDRHVIEAPARVFADQEEVKRAFDAGELDRDVVCVVRFQGPSANGMPELHGLTPLLGVLQDKGYRVALVTDGRMSGASGKIPAAIHVTPEAFNGGAIARINDGDRIRVDAEQGSLQVLESDFEQRMPVSADLDNNRSGVGRELFDLFRHAVGAPSAGASVFFTPGGDD